MVPTPKYGSGDPAPNGLNGRFPEDDLYVTDCGQRLISAHGDIQEDPGFAGGEFDTGTDISG